MICVVQLHMKTYNVGMETAYGSLGKDIHIGKYRSRPGLTEWSQMPSLVSEEVDCQAGDIHLSYSLLLLFHLSIT